MTFWRSSPLGTLMTILVPCTSAGRLARYLSSTLRACRIFHCSVHSGLDPFLPNLFSTVAVALLFTGATLREIYSFSLTSTLRNKSFPKVSRGNGRVGGER